MSRCDKPHPDGTSTCRFPPAPMHRDHIDDQRRVWSDPPPPKPETASQAVKRIAGADEGDRG